MTGYSDAPLPAIGLSLDGRVSGPVAVINVLFDWAVERRPRQLGYPVATDIDFTPVLALFAVFFNNIGDPSQPCAFNNAQQFERAVIAWFADLFSLPATDWWGYIATDGTEGNLSGVYTGRRRFADAVVYHSECAHYSVAKVADIVVGEKAVVVVRADEFGEMDYAHLDELVAQNRDRPAIVVATAGTTMTEACDDIARINAILDSHGVPGRHVHVDAALSGIPLALDGALQFGDAGGIDSITVSGHKWLGVSIPCSVVLMRESVRLAGDHVAYIGTLDTTISGSRSGQAAVLIWYAIATINNSGGHHQRVAAARGVAAYAVDRLNTIGWPAWRHEHAVTVVIRTPPAQIRTECGWILAEDGEQTHLVCTPGVSTDIIDDFVADLSRVIARGSDQDPSLATGVQPQQDGKLQCRYCDRWFKSLAPHVRSKQCRGVTADTYRTTFGLQGMPLMADDMRSRIGKRSKRWPQDDERVQSVLAAQAVPDPQRTKRSRESSAATRNRASAEASWQRTGAAAAKRAKQAGERLDREREELARERGYTGVRAWLEATDMLTNAELGVQLGGGPGTARKLRSRHGIRSRAKTAAAQQRAHAVPEPASAPAGVAGGQPVGSDGRLTCLECGQPWTNLGSHIEGGHRLSQQAYRLRHGIPGDWGALMSADLVRVQRESLDRAVAANAESRRTRTREHYDGKARDAGYDDIADLLARNTNREAARLLEVTQAQAGKLRRRYLPPGT
jgi:histidine decarboxylase